MFAWPIQPTPKVLSPSFPVLPCSTQLSVELVASTILSVAGMKEGEGEGLCMLGRVRENVWERTSECV